MDSLQLGCVINIDKFKKSFNIQLMEKRQVKTKELFKDAEFLYHEAIKELARKKLRNAAEKAWAATVRATTALILARR